MPNFQYVVAGKQGAFYCGISIAKSLKEHELGERTLIVALIRYRVHCDSLWSLTQFHS